MNEFKYTILFSPKTPFSQTAIHLPSVRKQNKYDAKVQLLLSHHLHRSLTL